MVEEQEALQNFTDLVDKIVVKYNKGVVLDFVTQHSFQIIKSSMEQLEERFETILSVFEEIQKEKSILSDNLENSGIVTFLLRMLFVLIICWIRRSAAEKRCKKKSINDLMKSMKRHPRHK